MNFDPRGQMTHQGFTSLRRVSTRANLMADQRRKATHWSIAKEPPARNSTAQAGVANDARCSVDSEPSQVL